MVANCIGPLERPNCKVEAFAESCSRLKKIFHILSGYVEQNFSTDKTAF